MKKTLFLLSAMFIAQLMYAKDYKLVVNHNGTTFKSNTEVRTDGNGDGETETMNVLIAK